MKDKFGNGMCIVWNNFIGGVLEWNFIIVNVIIDIFGDICWFMNLSLIYDLKLIYCVGVMMGFK